MKLNKIMAELKKYGEVEFSDRNGDYFTIRETTELINNWYEYTGRYMAYEGREPIFEISFSWKEIKNWIKEKISSK